jgi:predicted DNA-binding transcriptional regulator AlpA
MHGTPCYVWGTNGQERPKTKKDRLMKLLTEQEVCEMIGISCSTLRKWRLKGTGPTFVKFGKATPSPIRYPQSDLEAFIAQSTKHTQKLEKPEELDELEEVTEEEKEIKAEEKEDEDTEFDYYL